MFQREHVLLRHSEGLQTVSNNPTVAYCASVTPYDFSFPQNTNMFELEAIPRRPNAGLPSRFIANHSCSSFDSCTRKISTVKKILPALRAIEMTYFVIIICVLLFTQITLQNLLFVKRQLGAVT